MKCIDEKQQTDIFGSYNTDKASNLMIVFERCIDKDNEIKTCKEDKDIDDWLKYKYIVSLENEKTFVQDGFNEDSILRHS